MRIAIIGGLDRNENRYTEIASLSGHTIESHNGRIHGRGSDEIKKIISRASLVVIQMTVNSHGGVHLAKRMTRKEHKPALIIPRLGRSGLEMLLDRINRDPDYYVFR